MNDDEDKCMKCKRACIGIGCEMEELIDELERDGVFDNQEEED